MSGTRADVTPVVSVVMAARNEAERIAGAVESIRAQTLTDWELIVVDDGSSDETATVVEGFGDARISVVREAGSGLPASLNQGIATARAPLIARQDADDRSLPERLERQVTFLERRCDVAVVGARWIEVTGDGRRVRPRSRVVAGRLNDVLPRFNPIVHTAAMFRRDTVAAVGGYDERLPYAADYDLWLRLAHAGATLWNLDEELVVRVMSGANMSARRERAHVWEELQIRFRDIARRWRDGAPVGPQAGYLVRRAPMLVLPVTLKRRVRRLYGKAP